MIVDPFARRTAGVVPSGTVAGSCSSPSDPAGCTLTSDSSAPLPLNLRRFGLSGWSWGVTGSSCVLPVAIGS